MTERKSLKSQVYQPPNQEAVDARSQNATSQTHSRVDSQARVSNTAGWSEGNEFAPFIWWRSQLVLMVIAFTLLLVGAVLLTLLVPPGSSMLSQTNLSDPSTQASDQEGRQVDATQSLDLESAPWKEQQRLEARTQAQSILSELVSLKRSLQALRVEEWSQSDYESGLTWAEQGDDFYSLQEYSEALVKYRQALAALEAVEAKIPSIVKSYVTAANQDIALSLFDLGQDKFEKALALDPNHIPALAGLARLAVLPDVLAHLASAESNVLSYQDNNDSTYLRQAIQDYQNAIAVDPLATDELAISAQKQLEEVEQQLMEHRFSAAMTSAISAFLSGKYSVAQKEFSAALENNPEHVLAKQGLEQALALNTGNSISAMFAQARESEALESWQQAQSVYQAILYRDASQASARSGLVQARVRANLDASLRDYLEHPMRFTDSARRDDIKKTLSQAKGISRQGPILIQQIQQVEALLEGATKMVTVTLVSDSATTVFLQKRGAKPIQYQPFASKVLSLPPGRYVFSGERLGYQDVREELLIKPNTQGVQRLDVRSKVALKVGGFSEED